MSAAATEQAEGDARLERNGDDDGIPTEYILHWYDFICPFCYLAQPDNDQLVAAGRMVVEMGFSAHPETPPGGVHVGIRSGAMYASIDAQAVKRGLPLDWPDRLPNTRLALGASEWIRLNLPNNADRFRKAAFAAHFAEQRDIGDIRTVLAIAGRSGVPVNSLVAAIDGGDTDNLLAAAERAGRQHGVSGTPAWSYRGELVVGLQPGGLAQRLGVSR